MNVHLYAFILIKDIDIDPVFNYILFHFIYVIFNICFLCVLTVCLFSRHTFVHPNGELRSVHVDSEPKVVQKATKGLKIR
jgi:hypothetical protein